MTIQTPKQKIIDVFPLPLNTIMSFECVSCHYQFVVFDKKETEAKWSCLGVYASCPRCGARYKHGALVDEHGDYVEAQS